MIYEEIFRKVEAAGADRVYLRVSETHPVEMYLGFEQGHRAVMVICATAPLPPPTLSAIRFETRQRHDGRCALVLSLERNELKALFAHLVEDLENATLVCPEDPGSAVVRRLIRWQRLLSPRQSGLLSENQIRGLAAELVFLRDEAIPQLGPAAAIAGWRGPYEAPKDFTFAECEVEVKAVRPLQREISISSLEQLTDNRKPLFLWICEVETVAAPTAGAISLAALVDSIRRCVEEAPAASSQFDAGLEAVGYEERHEYAGVFLEVGSRTCFAVNDGFPRLRRPDVASGISDASYEIATVGLVPFVAPTCFPG